MFSIELRNIFMFFYNFTCCRINIVPYINKTAAKNKFINSIHNKPPFFLYIHHKKHSVKFSYFFDNSHILTKASSIFFS